MHDICSRLLTVAINDNILQLLIDMLWDSEVQPLFYHGISYQGIKDHLFPTLLAADTSWELAEVGNNVCDRSNNAGGSFYATRERVTTMSTSILVLALETLGCQVIVRGSYLRPPSPFSKQYWRTSLDPLCWNTENSDNMRVTLFRKQFKSRLDQCRHLTSIDCHLLRRY